MHQPAAGNYLRDRCPARGWGNAIDAAIAANAALSVVEPMICGPGGDLFAIFWIEKDKKPLFSFGVMGGDFQPQGHGGILVVPTRGKMDVRLDTRATRKVPDYFTCAGAWCPR